MEENEHYQQLIQRYQDNLLSEEEVEVFFHLLGAGKLDVQLTAEACFIKADRAQIEQVVMNLVVNARDAVRQDGTIRISTERVELTEAQLRGGRTLTPGSYVVLAVREDRNPM